MKKRICFINLHGAALYSPELESYIGGTEVDIWIISRMLLNLGYAVEVVVDVVDCNEYSWERDGITFHNLRSNEQSSSVRRLWGLWKMFRSVDCPLWFAKNISPPSALLALYCLLYKRNLIYKTANHRDMLLATGKGKYSLMQRFYFHVTRIGTRIYIAQNEDQRLAASKWFNKPGQEIVKIPNVHPPQSVEHLPMQEREFLLWVGHLKAIKRPELFLQLATKLPGFNFLMIATSRENRIASDYREQISKIPNLELIEDVPFRKMSGYFNRAQVLVNTSLSEGFPNTFLQAFQAVTPLATIGVDPDDMIMEANLGIVASDLQELANWLQELLQQPERYNQIQNNLECYNQEHFSYEIVKEQYQNIMKEIA